LVCVVNLDESICLAFGIQFAQDVDE